MVKKMTKWNYLEPFLFTKEKLHLEEISSKVAQNHTTVRNHLNAFAQEGFLRVSQKGRLTLYEVNKDFPLCIAYLSIAEKEFLIKQSHDPIFKELLSDLHTISTRPLILFGSVVTDYRKAEDIDIICLENIDIKPLETKYRKSFHILQVNDLKNISDALKVEIMKKHIVVNGVEEVVKWLR